MGCQGSEPNNSAPLNQSIEANQTEGENQGIVFDAPQVDCENKVIPKPVEVDFVGGMINSWCFSPLDKGKIWVSVIPKPDSASEIFEIEPRSGERLVLEKKFGKYLAYGWNGQAIHTFEDTYEDLIVFIERYRDLFIFK